MDTRWRMILVGALGLWPGALAAQEIQVPVDDSGRVEMITPDLARQLGLFTDVAGFREARLFRLTDSTFVLEVTSTVGAGLRRDRRPMTAAETAEFRHDVTARITARAPTAFLDQSGRTKLLVGATVLGLGYYGWATAVALDPNDSQTALAIYMLTAGGAFIIPLLATADSPITDGAATMALWGASRGPVHGALLADAIGDPSSKATLGVSVAFGATEAIAGGAAAASLDMTPGRAELTGIGGDIGLLTGLGMGHLLRLNDRGTSTTGGTPPYQYTTFQADRSLWWLAALGGAGLGLAGGYALGGTEEWTRGDAVIFRNATLIGALAGIAVGDIIQQPTTVTDSYGYTYTNDGYSRTHTAGALIGAAAGAVVGHKLVTGRNFTTGQGTLLTLSPLAGGLLGLGLAYIVTPRETCSYAYGSCGNNDHSELYLSMTTLGAAAGFWAMYSELSKQAPQAAHASNLNFSINPFAAAQLVGHAGGETRLLSLSYRF